MSNLNNELGLQVISTVPPQGMPNVGIHSHFEIEFSEDLDASTIANNIRVYQSVGGVFTSIGRLDDLTLFVPVDVRASYKDRVVKLETIKPMNANKDHVLIVQSMTVTSITGRQMLSHVTTLFKTEENASSRPVQLVAPGFGSILKGFPRLEWIGDANSYTIQISKEPSFSSILEEKQVHELSFLSEKLLNADEGIFYWRVRPESGEFSPWFNFFLKPTETMPISSEDAKERVVGLPWDDEIEVLEMFPEDGFSNVGLNLKTIYVKLKGLFFASDINFDMTALYGSSNDPTDTTIVDHGEVSGAWTVVRDELEFCTYLVFSIDKPIT